MSENDKPLKKRGGRRPGVKTQATKIFESKYGKVPTFRKMPLQQIIDIMNTSMKGLKDWDKKMQIMDLKLRAAAAAAPYCHTRFMAIKVENPPPDPTLDMGLDGIGADSPEMLEFARRVAFVLALGARAAAKQKPVTLDQPGEDRDEGD